MMTEHEVRKAIIQRLAAINGSCNETHIIHNEGVFRGLIWALTGTDPGTGLGYDCSKMLTLAGIKNREEGGVTYFDSDLDGEI